MSSGRLPQVPTGLAGSSLQPKCRPNFSPPTSLVTGREWPLTGATHPHTGRTLPITTTNTS